MRSLIIFFLAGCLVACNSRPAFSQESWDFFHEPAQVAAATTTEKKLVVYYFTTSDCVHCKTLKRDAEGLAAYKFIESETPAWVESFPSLMWEDSRGNWVRFVGWDRAAFLAKVKETRQPPVTAAAVAGDASFKGYPVKAPRWNVDGYDNPGKVYIIDHLMTAPAHVGEFKREYLESLAVKELLSLHSDDHDGKVQRAYLPQPAEKKEPQARPAAQYSTSYYQTTRRGRRSFFRGGGCPGGGCP